MTSESERQGTTHTEMQAARLDITIGMFFSQLIMYCIILTAAATLFAHGRHDVQSAQQAAEALRPFAGPLTSVVFAVGFVGTGLLAIPILSGSAAYAVKEFVGMGGSLAVKPKYRPTFYGVLAASTLIGVAINYVGIDPIKALFWSAVVNGVIAVPLMVLIVLLGARKDVMKRRVSGRLSLGLTGAATLLMGAAAIAMIVLLLPIPGLGAR